MDDYDEIYNYNGLKHSPFKFFIAFDLLFFMGMKIEG
jgi:hypothetical protein